MENKREICTRNCEYYIDKDRLILYAVETDKSKTKNYYELHLDVSSYPELKDDFKLIDYSKISMCDCGYDFINNLQKFKCTPGIKNKLDRYLWIMSLGGITSKDLGLIDTSVNDRKSEIKESKEELLNCIHNLMGCFDTPISRRLIKDPISNEARKIARKIMDNNGRSVLGR